jgi:TolA-binding protein
MNPRVKLFLYVVLAVCMVSCAAGLYATYHSKDAVEAPPPNVTSTNLPPAVAGVTNQTAQVSSDPGDDTTARRRSPRVGRMIAYGITMFFTLIGLAVMIGYDVSKFFANRVNEFIFNDDLKGMKDPEYEEAEHVWAKGDFLGAVGLMREYLKRHPREQYVALRIAEIYESDLRNYLAAALEYEEILKKKLPDERWGWAAVHLANLYSGKLNKPEQATALLHRIAEQYGHTAAAKKARERLGLPPPPTEAAAAPEPEPVVEARNEEPPASNMPKGFRPK